MTRKTRRNDSAPVTAKVTPASVTGERPLAEPAAQFDVHANMIETGKISSSKELPGSLAKANRAVHHRSPPKNGCASQPSTGG